MNPVVFGVALLGLGVAGPWSLARGALIPLGWPRATWLATRLSPLLWIRDRTGGALFAAAWALCRQPAPDRRAVAWIRSQIPSDAPLTAANLATLGLVAAARGDHVEARSFLGAALLFDDRIVDTNLRRHVSRWLVAEAAGRGAWDDVLRFAAGAPRSGRVDWAAAVARRILGRPDAPDDDALESLWSRVPSLHRAGRAVMVHVRRGAVPRAHPFEPTADPLDTALSLQVAALRGGGATALRTSARAWEAALATLEPRLRARAAELGARRGDDALTTLRRQVELALAEVAEAAGTPLTELGAGLMGDAAARVRDHHLATIELAAEALQSRLDAGRLLDPIDEAREWLALARLYQDGVEAVGDEVRRLVFRPVYHPLCTLSVQLYNERNQRWLSNAMTRWLLREARLAGDQRAAELQERNLSV